MYDTTTHFVEITTGVYKNGSKQQQELVGNLFGMDKVEEYYEIYFHWYNVIHELGHALIASNLEESSNPVEEEQLVNDFAVAYWRYYGEEGKLKLLEEIVSDTLPRFTRPAAKDVVYLDYAKEKWGKEELYRFNNYGWFQFNCVSASLKKQIPLVSILQKMGGVNITEQNKERFLYIVDESMAASIIKDATNVMAKWGMKVPSVKMVYSNDLNEHMCKILPL
ncbi:hypothetical protein ACFQZR_20715 [Paenibacillus sp. GCM10027629]|uniref:hypothetical protein n=1 Tax=Paenibacillus sp. GCM10027629 TaxID=3273414 RepID=UPI00362F5819